jgi:hypothetical protein
VKRKLALFVTTAIAAASTSVLAAPVAHADTIGCVSPWEFSLVKHGWTKTRVYNLFDTGGSVTYQAFGVMDREYRVCTSGTGSAWVEYSHYNGAWRVQGKGVQWN